MFLLQFLLGASGVLQAPDLLKRQIAIGSQYRWASTLETQRKGKVVRLA